MSFTGRQRQTAETNDQTDFGFLDQARLTWRLYRDPRVSTLLKVMLPAIAVLYLLSPIDLIPDFLLGLGQIDDLGILTVAVLVISKLMPRLVPEPIVAEHRSAMGSADGLPSQPSNVVIDTTYQVRDSARS